MSNPFDKRGWLRDHGEMTWIRFGFDDYETNELCGAAYNGDTTAIARLLDAGTDIEERDERAKSPLDYAIQEKKFAAALLLLERGAQIHGFGPRYLIAAANAGHLPLAKKLMSLGVSPNDKAENGWNALSVAMEHNDRAMIALFVDQRVGI